MRLLEGDYLYVIIFSAPGYHHFSHGCSDIYKTMCNVKLASFRISVTPHSFWDLLLYHFSLCFSIFVFFGFRVMKFMIVKSFRDSGTHLEKEAHFEDISVFY